MAAQRRPKAVDPPLMATIITYAWLHSGREASERFGYSERAIQRWNADLRAGKHPEVAALVAQYKQESIDANRDLLAETLDSALREFTKRLGTISEEWLVRGIEALTKSKVARDYISGDEPVLPTPRAPGAKAAEGEPSGGTGGASGTPDGSPGARGPRSTAPN